MFFYERVFCPKDFTNSAVDLSLLDGGNESVFETVTFKYDIDQERVLVNFEDSRTNEEYKGMRFNTLIEALFFVKCLGIKMVAKNKGLDTMLIKIEHTDLEPVSSIAFKDGSIMTLGTVKFAIIR